jgi:NADH-quinone oxidoreductase subunit J
MTGLPLADGMAAFFVSSVPLLAEEAAALTVWDRAGALAKHPVAWSVLLFATAMYLMLPRGNAKGRGIGAVLGVAALGCLTSQLLPLGTWSANVVFWILGGVTLIAAVCTVTFRNPVYCAVWFALALMGTAGLFMVQGAQFLAVATVVVYAGAILVTFLFVLMLAQPRGDAYYDRVSWEAMLAAATGAVLVGILSMTVGKLSLASEPSPLGRGQGEGAAAAPSGTLTPALSPRERELQKDVLTPDHVARLGAELFGRHLIAVEVAGTLLLVALIGATAIVSAGKRRHRSSQQETAR